ncbi:MAG: hypothetical protein ABFE13_17725 [Phycisphaerales bacterium]
MIPTGRSGQVQETLLGVAAMGNGRGKNAHQLLPPFGEVYVDKAGRPCAVVCHMRENDYPAIPGLSIEVAEGPSSGLVSVTYTRERKPRG